MSKFTLLGKGKPGHQPTVFHSKAPTTPDGLLPLSPHSPPSPSQSRVLREYREVSFWIPKCLKGLSLAPGFSGLLPHSSSSLALTPSLPMCFGTHLSSHFAPLPFASQPTVCFGPWACQQVCFGVWVLPSSSLALTPLPSSLPAAPEQSPRHAWPLLCTVPMLCLESTRSRSCPWMARRGASEVTLPQRSLLTECCPAASSPTATSCGGDNLNLQLPAAGSARDEGVRTQ